MLKEERHLKIVELVNSQTTVSTNEIADKLDISLATARRAEAYFEAISSIMRFFLF